MTLSNAAKIWLISPALILAEGWAMRPVALVGLATVISYLAFGAWAGRMACRRLKMWRTDDALNPCVVGATTLCAGMLILLGSGLPRLSAASGAGARVNVLVAVLLALVFAPIFTAIATFLADLLMRPVPAQPPDKAEDGRG